MASRDATTFALSVTLNKEKITLDDFLYLDAEFRYPPTFDLNLEKLIDQLTWSANPLSPQLSITHTAISSLKSEEGVVAKHLHAVIRPLVQGSLQVTFLKVSFEPKDQKGTSADVLTPVFTVQVTPPNQQIALAYAPLIPLEPQFPLGLTEKNRQVLWDDPVRKEAEKRYLHD